MSYRKFWLINGAGKKYDLTDIYQTAFLSAPSGLGTTASIEMTRLGNSQKTSSYKFNMDQFGGTLIFKNNSTNASAYESYLNFFTFANELPLYFHQQPPNMVGESYHCEALLSSLSKSEINIDSSRLEVPVQFQPLTFWKNDKVSIIEADKTSKLGKSYELKRPYHYSSIGYEDMRIFNKSATIIPVIIEIEGTALNPQYQLFDSNGIVYGIGKFNGEFDYVYVNSSDLEEEIKLSRNGGWLLNPVNYQDFSIGTKNSYLTFVYLKPGQNGFKFTFDNEFNGKVRISWRETYATI